MNSTPESKTDANGGLWILIFGALVLVPTLAVVILNVYVDPFNYLDLHLYKYDKQLTRKRNIRLWCVLDLKKLSDEDLANVEVVTVGDSRTRWFTTERDLYAPRITTYRGVRTLNLGCSGTTIDESNYLLKEFSPRLPQLKLVITNVSFFRLGQRGQNRLRKLSRFESPFEYFLSRHTAGHSLRILRMSEQEASRRSANYQKKPSRKRTRRIIEEWKTGTRRFRMRNAKARLGRLRGLTETIDAKFIFWSPPVVRQISSYTKTRKRYKWYKRQVGKLGKHYNDFEKTKEPMRDPVHGARSVERFHAIMDREFFDGNLGSRP